MIDVVLDETGLADRARDRQRKFKAGRRAGKAGKRTCEGELDDLHSGTLRSPRAAPSCRHLLQKMRRVIILRQADAIADKTGFMRPFERLSGQSKHQIVRIANREVETRGLSSGFWTDIYHHAMAVSWPGFFAWAGAVFIILNSVYAFLYYLGDKPVANVRYESFLEFFFFSIETLATVGYGDMHPQTNYGHLIATVEIFTGMSFLAVMTGLVFARFSRPKARFVFARHVVVTRHIGRPTLMIRVANARHNTISGATAKLWLIRAEVTPEGQTLRRYYELTLERQENPVFAFSWTIFHVIDEFSALSGLDANHLARSEAALVLTLSGFDDNSAQQLWARQGYSHTDIRWQHRYADITSWADGRMILDYNKFHDVEKEQVSVTSNPEPAKVTSL
jgi:inward rectifier potassium channel